MFSLPVGATRVSGGHLMYKFYLFWISSLNLNPSNIAFSNLVFILWISIFFLFALILLQKFYCFIIHHSIQVDGILFFNLVLVVLISNFFSWLFCKSYHSFQFYLLITTLFLFFMSILSQSFLIFIGLIYWFFFSISLFN
jgi:hypothetical protein